MFAAFFKNKFRKVPGNINHDVTGTSTEVSLSVNTHNEYTTLTGTTATVNLELDSHNEYTTLTGTNAEVPLTLDTHNEYTTLTGTNAEVPLTLDTHNEYTTLTGTTTEVSLSVSGPEASYTAPAYVETGIQLYYNPEDPSSYSGSGTSITDLSGNGFTGTISGATHSTNSFLYDGTDDFIYTPNMYSAFNSTTHFTLEVWYNPTWTLQGQGGTVVSEASDITHSSWHYALVEHERARFGGLAYDYAGIWNGALVNISPYATKSGWRQIVLSYDGTNGVSYTNAATPRTVAVSRWTPWTNGGVNSYLLTIGRRDTTNQSGASNYFKGNIGIVRLYNRALTATEITANYNSTKSIYGL